jgi:filamentous hemagglutinin
MTKNITKSLRKRGMPSRCKTAGRISSKSVDEQISCAAADMVAGGWMRHETPVGRADVNKSRASWNSSLYAARKPELGEKPLTRVQEMDREAKNAIDNGRGDQKMNVKLEPCRGKGI